MQINVAVKVGACESNQTNINITVRNGQGKRSTPGTGKRSTHGQGKRTSEFLQEVKQDKQSNLPGEDWRDAVVVVWTLVLTVAAEKDDVGRR
jgi:hypothetical protein